MSVSSSCSRAGRKKHECVGAIASTGCPGTTPYSKAHAAIIINYNEDRRNNRFGPLTDPSRRKSSQKESSPLVVSLAESRVTQGSKTAWNSHVLPANSVNFPRKFYWNSEKLRIYFMNNCYVCFMNNWI